MSDNEIKDVIKTLRKNREFTQKDMAEMLEISPKHFNQIERGKILPNWKMLNRILGLLGAKIVIEADLIESVVKTKTTPKRYTF